GVSARSTLLPYTTLFRSAGRNIALGELVRIANSIAVRERAAQDVVDKERGRQFLDFLPREPLHRVPQALPHGKLRAKRGDVVLVRQQEQVADLIELDFGAGLFFEGFESVFRKHRHADVDLGAELRANAAGALGGGAVAEVHILLDNSDFPKLPLGKIERNRTPENPPTDDD